MNNTNTLNLASPSQGAIVLADAVWQSRQRGIPRLAQLYWIQFNCQARVSLVRIWKVPKSTVGPLDIMNYPVDFSIQTSPDGGRTFRDLLHLTGNRLKDEEQSSEHIIEPTETDNIRLVVHKAFRDNWFPYYRNFKELEVMG
ncbi:MAG: hypothetical protein AABZ61_01735, partial [Bacteroidota bacterium]